MAPRKWKQYRPDPTPDPDGGPGAPKKAAPKPAAYQPPKQQKKVRTLEERTVRRTGGGPAAKLVVAAFVAVAGVTTLIFVLSGGGDEPGADQPQTDKGFDALVDALKEERGSSLVRNAIIYPEYAVVDVPYKLDDTADEREISYYWDGALRESTKGTGDEEVFDLADVDSAILDGLCPQVEQLVEDPEDCSIYITKPDAEDPTPEWITASTSNEFGQSAYIDFALDGTVIETRPPA